MYPFPDILFFSVYHHELQTTCDYTIDKYVSELGKILYKTNTYMIKTDDSESRGQEAQQRDH